MRKASKLLLLGGVAGLAGLFAYRGEDVAATVLPADYPRDGRKLTVDEALALAGQINREMGIWFGWNGYTLKQVVAMWMIESALDPRAIGDDGSSLGIGQVQRPTAADVGVTGDLLDPYYGAKASMLYLKELKRLIQSKNGGRSVSFEQLVMAYNGGIGNYWRGTIPAFTTQHHIPRFREALARL